LDPLLRDAESILEAAESCARAGRPPEDWAILLGAGGRIEMIPAAGWSLEALRRERGAETAFRVGASGGRIAVEGRTSSRACRLESESPASVARRLLGSPPRYGFLRPALASPAE
jgi:hypothetical protein